MNRIARLAWTALDCRHPRELAEFCSAITGWPIDDAGSDEGWVQLAGDEGATLAFQRVDAYRPPQWPGQEHPQQEHRPDSRVSRSGPVVRGLRSRRTRAQASSYLKESWIFVR